VTGTAGLLGLVTIGQAPRTDVLADLAPLLTGRTYVEHGALDDLDEHDAAAFTVVAPGADETPLVSRAAHRWFGADRPPGPVAAARSRH
jgi:protein AroM